MFSRFSISIVGVENRPPEDVPFGHVDYLELKAMEVLSAQEKILPPTPLAT